MVAVALEKYLFQVEPGAAIAVAVNHPPEGFLSVSIPIPLKGEGFSFGGAPAFACDFDVFTTADGLLRRIGGVLDLCLPSHLMRPRVLFVGSCLSEFVLLPSASQMAMLPDAIFAEMRRLGVTNVVVKDIPAPAPFFSSEEKEQSSHLAQILQKAGFVLIDGQAVAYVPIDFDSVDEFLGRFPGSRRNNIRRKLKKRAAVRMEIISTGSDYFSDEQTIDLFYRLYLMVHHESDVLFDRLTRDFWRAILQDRTSNGLVFIYYLQNSVIGFRLCYTHGQIFDDKYVGFLYPEARENNLYYLTWFDMLEYCLAHGFAVMINGVTDLEIKSYLGAQFNLTRHAIYTKSGFWRGFVRFFNRYLESDRVALERWQREHRPNKLLANGDK